MDEDLDMKSSIKSSFENQCEKMNFEYYAYDENSEADKYPLSLKLKLLKEIKRTNQFKNLPCKDALKYLEWNTFNIEGYTLEDCKECLSEMLRPLSLFRTLDEMLTDFEVNYQEYLFPRTAVMRFIDDNREIFRKELCKMKPDMEIGTDDIIAYGAKKFKSLPVQEKAVYKIKHQKDLLKYYKMKYEKCEKRANDLIPILNRAKEKLSECVDKDDHENLMKKK